MRYDRRTFLSTIAAGFLAQSARGADDLSPEESASVEAVRQRAETVALKEVDVETDDRYIVVGDAPREFRTAALNLMNGLAKDWLAHFTDHGFDLHPPKSRLVIVALSGPQAFAAYLDKPVDQAVGGTYDLFTNRFVFFDNRARANAGPQVARANTLVLMHEGTHQLVYNCGLLDRESHLSEAINEGIGCYSEPRRPDGRGGKIGDVNTDRLRTLRDTRAWIPLEDLLTKDDAISAVETQVLAYAQSWLLIHLLMTRDWRTKFKAYMTAVKPRRNDTNRLLDLESTLGDLKLLSTALKKHHATLTRRR